MSVRSFSFDEQPWERVDDRLRRFVADGMGVTVTRYAFEPGGRFPHHRHDQEQVTYVVEGELTFVVENERYPLRADGVIIIPRGLPHRAEAGPHGAQVISVVTPRRSGPEAVEMLEVD
ncbi:MAG: cupin domain-containing protein [Actinomycetota bacterium]